MKVRPKAPGTSKTKYNPLGADLLRAYRKKRNRKRKLCYRDRLYNIKHGKFGGKQ